MPVTRIMILNDDHNVCAFVSHVLSQIGLSSTICHHASDLEAVHETGIPFSLIVTTVVPPPPDRASIPALLESMFPDVPVLHLEEVIPFSVDNFERMVLLRLQEAERSAF